MLPAAGARPATQTDIEGVLVAMDAMDTRLEGRLDRVEGRLGGVESEVRGLAERIDGIIHRVNADAERRFTDRVTDQTRSLMLSLFGTVVVIAALAFGLR